MSVGRSRLVSQQAAAVGVCLLTKDGSGLEIGEVRAFRVYWRTIFIIQRRDHIVPSPCCRFADRIPGVGTL